MGAAVAAKQRARQRFCLVLVKPSHYDDDGYVIQWFRSPIPSNSLASLFGLAKDCAERKILGEDVDIEIHAFDETNSRIRPHRLAAMIEEAGAGMVMLTGVQSNQFPRALDLAKPLRERGIQVGIGGFHVSGVLAMLNGVDADLDRAKAMGVSLFAGEAEGRLDEVLCDACRRRAQAALQFHGRPARHRGHADPADGGRARAAHCRRHDHLRRRPRLSLSMLVLHHHQRAGAQVAPPLAGRRRKDRAGELRAGPACLLHHRRQFRPQQGLGADPRPAHLFAGGREVQHQLHHPGRHALPQDCRTSSRNARAPASSACSSGWRTSIRTIWLGAKKKQNKITEYRADAAGLEERRRHHLCRLHPRLPQRHGRVDHARHRRDQARTAGRSVGVLLPDAAAGFRGSSQAASRPARRSIRTSTNTISTTSARRIRRCRARSGTTPTKWRGSAITPSITSRQFYGAWPRPRRMPATHCS